MKETWKMIALLAIAIGGLLAYAFIPEQVAENIPLKQIGMDALTGKSEAELAEEEKADSMIKEPVDTAAYPLSSHQFGGPIHIVGILPILLRMARMRFSHPFISAVYSSLLPRHTKTWVGLIRWI